MQITNTLWACLFYLSLPWIFTYWNYKKTVFYSRQSLAGIHWFLNDIQKHFQYSPAVVAICVLSAMPPYRAAVMEFLRCQRQANVIFISVTPSKQLSTISAKKNANISMQQIFGSVKKCLATLTTKKEWSFNCVHKFYFYYCLQHSSTHFDLLLNSLSFPFGSSRTDANLLKILNSGYATRQVCIIFFCVLHFKNSRITLNILATQ